MPEKKMLKKSNLFKTKRTSQQNWRTKSVNKNDSCKKCLFIMCIRNQFVHTNVDFGYLEESKMRMPSYKDYVHWSCIPSKLFFSEGSSQDNLFWPNSPVSRKVILLLIRIWATLGALPLWPRITSWWDRSKQVFECEWMCMPMRLYTMTWQSIWSKLASWTYSGITLDIKFFSLWRTS